MKNCTAATWRHWHLVSRTSSMSAASVAATWKWRTEYYRLVRFRRVYWCLRVKRFICQLPYMDKQVLRSSSRTSVRLTNLMSEQSSIVQDRFQCATIECWILQRRDEDHSLHATTSLSPHLDQGPLLAQRYVDSVGSSLTSRMGTSMTKVACATTKQKRPLVNTENGFLMGKTHFGSNYTICDHKNERTRVTYIATTWY